MQALFSDIMNCALQSYMGKDELKKAILEQEYFYLPFMGEKPFLIDEITLPVLLQESSANIYVCKTAAGCCVNTMRKEELLALISDLTDLQEVRFYSTVPIHISYSPHALLENRLQVATGNKSVTPKPNPAPSPKPDLNELEQKPKVDVKPHEQEETVSLEQKSKAVESESSKPMDSDKLEAQSALPEAEEKLDGEDEGKRVLLGVDRVREYFSTLDVSRRQKMDPGHRFANIRTLVETLYQQNMLDPAGIDDALGFTKNFTNDFIRNPAGKPVPKETVLKYLRYFGLEEYWITYQDCCPEIKREILKSQELNQFKLKYPAGLYAEKFRLTEICEGKYDGGIIYRVKLEGETDTVQFYVTNPMKPPLKIDRVYQLLDRDGKERKEDEKRKAEDKIQPPSQSELADILANIQTKKAPVKGDRTFEQVRKDKIIFYLKDKLKLQLPSAESKYKEFECDPDILNEFYEYIINHRFGKLEIQGYTARKLIKDLKITEPYEAFHYLLELRSSPGETKQKLKLLEGSLKAKRMESAGGK